MNKLIIYFSIAASMLGANIFFVNLGNFRFSLFRITMLILILILMVKLIANGKIIFKKENLFSIKVMFFWLFYGIISIAWVKDYGGWFQAVLFLTIGFFAVLVYSQNLKTNLDILYAFRVIVIMIVLHNLIGWYEIITGNYMFLELEKWYLYARFRQPVSIFYNTNNFATFLLISIFIVYICFLATNKKTFKIIYTLTITSSVYLLISTGSRANILGLISGLFILVFFSVQKKSIRRTLFVVLGLVFIALLILPLNYGELILALSERIHFNFGTETSSDGVRTNLIKNGFVFLMETYGFGTGAGNVEYWMSNYGVYNTGGVINIHNWWLEILVGYGLLTFILYMLFYLKVFFSLVNKFKCTNDKIERSISLGLLCCITVFIIGSISSSSNIISEWLWVFWAIVIAYQGIELNSLSYSNDEYRKKCQTKISS